MAASIAPWFGASLTLSSASSSHPPAATMNIMEACNKPMRQRCYEIASFIHSSSSKELHCMLQPLLDNIFGYNYNPGWGLHAASQMLSKDDCIVLQDFLTPTGPLMTMVYKLQADGFLRYEFPIVNLPAPTRDAILNGAMPGFYANKLSYQTQGIPPTCVSLTAFEYFMYCLAYSAVHQHKQQSSQQWIDSDDWLYPSLVNEYLHYFLPVDGSGVPPAPFTPNHLTGNVSQSHHSPPYRLPQYGVLFHYLNSGSTQHGRLFLSNVTSAHQTQQQPLFNLQQSSPVDYTTRETWRSETLLQALGEFWLSQNTLQPKEQGFRQRVRENYIPSSDHVRVVRILVKHLHFFVNSARPPMATTAYQQPEQDQLDDLKRYVIPQFIKKKLYTFLRHGFDYWPLDSTFRQILEVWLSYIQPWRYTDQTKGVDRSPMYGRETTRDRPIQKDRWMRFVSSNLLFYTVLFQEYLPRAFRQDLTGPKNAILLFRVAKVFAQSNLPRILQEAEAQLVEHYHSPMRHPSDSFGSSYISHQHTPSPQDLRSMMAELETQGFTYKPLFSDDFKSTIERLLQIVSQAQATISNINYSPIADTNGEGLLSWLGLGDLTSRGQGSSGRHQLQDDIGPADASKLSKYLESVMENLCKIFQVHAPLIHEGSMIDRPRLGSCSSLDSDQSPDCVDGMLSPLGRKQLMNGLRKFEISYQGDPDLQPVRSFENAFLVETLHQVSTYINSQCAEKILELYHRPGFSGAVAREFFSPLSVTPTHRPRHTPTRNLSFGTTPIQSLGNAHQNRPRVTLRFLASYYTLFKLVVFCVILGYLGLGPVGVVLVLAVTVMLYGVIGAAMHGMRSESQTHQRLD